VIDAGGIHAHDRVKRRIEHTLHMGFAQPKAVHGVTPCLVELEK